MSENSNVTPLPQRQPSNEHLAGKRAGLAEALEIVDVRLHVVSEDVRAELSNIADAISEKIGGLGR